MAVLESIGVAKPSAALRDTFRVMAVLESIGVAKPSAAL